MQDKNIKCFIDYNDKNYNIYCKLTFNEYLKIKSDLKDIIDKI